MAIACLKTCSLVTSLRHRLYRWERSLLEGVNRLYPKAAYHRANAWWLIVLRGLAECCLGRLLMPCLGQWPQLSLPKP